MKRGITASTRVKLLSDGQIAGAGQRSMVGVLVLAITKRQNGVKNEWQED